MYNLNKMGGSPGQREPQIKKIVQDKIVLEFDFSGGLFNKILKFVGPPWVPILGCTI